MCTIADINKYGNSKFKGFSRPFRVFQEYLRQNVIFKGFSKTDIKFKGFSKPGRAMKLRICCISAQKVG